MKEKGWNQKKERKQKSGFNMCKYTKKAKGVNLPIILQSYVGK